jgi:hypothetical protein
MVDHLNEGLVCVTNAVQLDQAQNFKEAAPMYDLALFHLKLALLSMSLSLFFPPPHKFVKRAHYTILYALASPEFQGVCPCMIWLYFI